MSPDPPTPDSGVDVGVSPSPPSSVESLSPEQRDRMAKKKFEAESKRIAVMVGASLGASWLEALFNEFKKPYIKEVCMQWYMFTILSIRPFFSLVADGICKRTEKAAHYLSTTTRCVQLDTVMPNTKGTYHQVHLPMCMYDGSGH